VLRGSLGTSYANGESVRHLVGVRIYNSAVLVLLAGTIGTAIGVVLGMLAAARRDGWLDSVLSVISLSVTALPEFVVALFLVMLFASLALHILPGVSFIPPGVSPWAHPSELVLPVATLVIVIVPYIFRMMRGAMIEALESDYVEMAKLKGVRRLRVMLVHALPNSVAPTIQVIGLNLLYLAGGIVVVEYVFAYPGLGAGLVDAVSARDIPTIQFITLVLATFYVFMNILTDVAALLASPRRRLPRT
jgi:peptide/nickel transport system permease protein